MNIWQTAKPWKNETVSTNKSEMPKQLGPWVWMKQWRLRCRQRPSRSRPLALEEKRPLERELTGLESGWKGLRGPAGVCATAVFSYFYMRCHGCCPRFKLTNFALRSGWMQMRWCAPSVNKCPEGERKGLWKESQQGWKWLKGLAGECVWLRFFLTSYMRCNGCYPIIQLINLCGGVGECN